MSTTTAPRETRYEPSPDHPRVAAAMAARHRLDEAMRTGDVETLGSLFADDMVVQTPGHRVIDGVKILSVYAKSGGKEMYEGGMAANFEFVGLRGDGVIMMGEEVMPPAPLGPNAGKVVRRRFTDIWTDIGGGVWKLTCRQATNISAE